MKSATGGTFAIIHKGHTKLFYECVKRNTNVTVGVTLFPLVEKYHPVPSFEIRSYNVKKFFITNFNIEPEIFPLKDHYGPVIFEKDYSYLITSEENLPYACEINKIRISKGFSPVTIIVVETVRAFDGRPISTTRILNGEINIDGEPLNHYVGECQW
ncbi:hypothetical protein B9Q02_00230 [Candidatus Marsarchaeota G1 archaeon BE_D]|jgi:pantetheine-phosphate adenylyltransferase|uniref:Cytidyltransferase-like domain-containing protein n=1 Tax=Candidatus Marsarchaeota G1 archaeon BE_D TaxID=1978156 RepID=A0A2R6AKG2_9ARCH|nr:MAG: hypothetical protein B9Q02_00230 [Candidatus Marsarchaeota G1 archaeon BE_D]